MAARRDQSAHRQYRSNYRAFAVAYESNDNRIALFVRVISPGLLCATPNRAYIIDERKYSIFSLEAFEYYIVFNKFGGHEDLIYDLV